MKASEETTRQGKVYKKSYKIVPISKFCLESKSFFPKLLQKRADLWYQQISSME